MKKLMFFMVALCAAGQSFSQAPRHPAASDPFPRLMEAVVHDFPNNFRNISGPVTLQQAEVDNFASLILLPGAEDCHITRYHSTEDTLASWQAKMFRTEDYQQAARRYSQLFNQLKDCYLRLVDGSIIYVKGDWEAPAEEKPFSMSSFRLLTGDHRYQEMKIDVEMVYQVTEWVININVVNKKKDSLEGYAGSQEE